MPTWAYAKGIGRAQDCSEATALLKVARHASCCHGWRLVPDSNSPYEEMPPVHVPGASACQCTGMLPPKGLNVTAGDQQQEGSLQELRDVWGACGRCAHPLLDHGELMLDPAEERVRRTKVAIRMDELLEDEQRLCDFAYSDLDLDSLRKYVV